MYASTRVWKPRCAMKVISNDGWDPALSGVGAPSTGLEARG